jgi:hypothetical protein
MNKPTQPEQRSWIARCCRGLFTRRGAFRAVLVFAWLVTSVALIYGIENWRGRRAWKRYERELQARGEQLDLRDFIPKPVAAEENFAATPFVQSWFSQAENNEIWRDGFDQASEKVSKSTTGDVPKEKSFWRFTDLLAWEAAFGAEPGSVGAPPPTASQLEDASRARAAKAVLDALKESESQLGELRAASQKPHSRYPVVYDLENPWQIRLPHLVNIKRACQRLQLGASARLVLGQSAEAHNDVQLMLFLADSVRDEPLLISWLVRNVCVQIALRPVWEGLAERRWSDSQLRDIQDHVARYRFLPGLDRALDCERAAAILTADLLYRGKFRFSDLAGEPRQVSLGEEIAAGLARMAPRGWCYREQVNYCRLFDKQFGGTFDVEQNRIFPERVELRDCELEQALARSIVDNRALNGVLNHRALAALILPALGGVARKSASAQVASDHVVIACALERYRLAKATLPESLQALVPEFVASLPRDPLTGDVYKYRRTNDGLFVLYSVGWNERDDGGSPGTKSFDEREGDWVWQYPVAGHGG